PRPVPLWEIFVYSPDMAGVHLRGGTVARGGIRWSDRLEDYRTEILGLMKAQMVKNAVIVPVGAKGGFVLKNPPADRAELREEERRQYITLMRGMLDLTDNMVGGEVVHPAKVRVLDGPDPYLEVSFDERERMFALPTSSWDDYNRELISAGGGIWPRIAKSIPLSPQAREALGIEAERLTPTEVIHAILCAPVDLLWNGG